MLDLMRSQCGGGDENFKNQYLRYMMNYCITHIAGRGEENRYDKEQT